MKRIQRKRTKGWRMPENSIYVGRPTKWGNPIRLNGDIIYIDAGYRRKILSPWVYWNVGDIEDVIHLYWHIANGTQFQNVDLQYWSDRFKELDLSELEGKDLVCWCPLNQPCHADVLIKLCMEHPFLL